MEVFRFFQQAPSSYVWFVILFFTQAKIFADVKFVVNKILDRFNTICPGGEREWEAYMPRFAYVCANTRTSALKKFDFS